MSRHKDQSHKLHRKFTHEAHRNNESLFTRVSALIAATALTIAIAPNAKILYRSIPFNECHLGDDASIAEYEKKIDDIFNSDLTYETTDLPGTSYEDRPKIKMIKVAEANKTKFGPAITGRVSELLSHTSPKFIKASGVHTIRVQDIEKDFDLPDSAGLFTLSLPHSIVIDYPNLAYTVNVAEDESNYELDQATLNGVIIHEMGHAAVAEFCYTSNPPKEFIDASNHFEPDLDTYPNAEPYYTEGSVSNYAITNPAEDIAETIQAIMGTPWYDPAVNMLQLSLDDDNPILREKVAVILSMFDKLEPGLGDDALAKMKSSRNNLLINDALDHLEEPRG